MLYKLLQADKARLLIRIGKKISGVGSLTKELFEGCGIICITRRLLA